MLKARVLTAVPLAALLLTLVWWLPTLWLAALFAVVSLVAAWEWAGLSGLRGRPAKTLYIAVVGAALVGLWVSGAASGEGARAWAIPGVLWWLGILLVLLAWSRTPARRPLPASVRLSAGIVTLALAWLGLVVLHGRGDEGPFWLTACFLLVWGADSGGYFAGRKFGRRRLAPALSPGKTWEGALGGLGLALVLVLGFAWAGSFWLDNLPGIAWLVPVAAIVVAASIIGDLAESLLKRWAGVKDSGHILPGHGGVLDRIDALLAGAPILAAALAGVSA